MTFKEIKLLNYNIKVIKLTKENISFFIMMDLFNQDVCMSPAIKKKQFFMTSQEIKFLSIQQEIIKISIAERTSIFSKTDLFNVERNMKMERKYQKLPLTKTERKLESVHLELLWILIKNIMEILLLSIKMDQLMRNIHIIAEKGVKQNIERLNILFFICLQCFEYRHEIIWHASLYNINGI